MRPVTVTMRWSMVMPKSRMNGSSLKSARTTWWGEVSSNWKKAAIHLQCSKLFQLLQQFSMFLCKFVNVIRYLIIRYLIIRTQLNVDKGIPHL